MNQDFDPLAERKRFIAAVERGLADAAAGRLIDDADLDREFANRTSRAKPPAPAPPRSDP